MVRHPQNVTNGYKLSGMWFYNRENDGGMGRLLGGHEKQDMSLRACITDSFASGDARAHAVWLAALLTGDPFAPMTPLGLP